MEYYTYAYLREDGTPYYIGKGKCDRIYSKNRKNKPPKDKSRIIYLKQNLTEEEAFKHEIYMIAVFGRKDLGTGILHNKTDGGEGSSNIIRTKEHMNALMKGRANYSFTDKVKQVLPEMLEKRIKVIHGKILFFWKMGFIDIDDPRNSNPTVMLSEKAFDEDAVMSLPEERRLELEHIKKLFER